MGPELATQVPNAHYPTQTRVLVTVNLSSEKFLINYCFITVMTELCSFMLNYNALL